MAQSKKELVLRAMDRREVERVPSGFWFHFLADEIHADAYADPRLEQTLLDGELRYIDGFQPDFVKIMTDGFFSYPNPVVQTARTAKELAKVQPLLYAADRLCERDHEAVRERGRHILQSLLCGHNGEIHAARDTC